MSPTYQIRLEAHRRTSSVDTLSILVVSGNAETRRNLYWLLDRVEPGFDVVGLAGFREDAFRFTTELQPKVILIDFPFPSMEQLGEIDRLSLRSPASLFVIIIPEGAVMLPWHSLSGIVKAVFIKPPSANALIDAIRYAGGQGQSSSQRLYGQSRIGDLAQRLHLAEDDMQAVVDSLERHGLVSLHRDWEGHQRMIAAANRGHLIVVPPHSQDSPVPQNQRIELSPLEHRVWAYLQYAFDETHGGP